jgi:hypothetical protein
MMLLFFWLERIPEIKLKMKEKVAQTKWFRRCSNINSLL